MIALAAAAGLLAAAVVALNLWVLAATRGYVFDDISSLRADRAGLLLGTSPYMRGGGANPFFERRLDAAAALYRAGKVRFIIASGDNRSRWYDEPGAMKKSLEARGVPRERIYLDGAGLNTLDSVARCRELFGQESFTIISQGSHNRRAVFLARGLGCDAVGYDAADVGWREAPKTRLRECLARAGAALYVALGLRPRVSGEKIGTRD